MDPTTFPAPPSDMMHYTTRDNRVVHVPASTIRGPPPDINETAAHAIRQLEQRSIHFGGSSTPEEALKVLKTEVESTRRLVCGVMQNQRKVLESVHAMREKLLSELAELKSSNANLTKQVAYANADASLMKANVKTLQRMIKHLRAMVEDSGASAMGIALPLPPVPPVPPPPHLPACTGTAFPPTASGEESNIYALCRTSGMQGNPDADGNDLHERIQAFLLSGEIRGSRQVQNWLREADGREWKHTVPDTIPAPLKVQVQEVLDGLCATRDSIPVLLQNLESLDGPIKALVENSDRWLKEAWEDHDKAVDKTFAAGYQLRALKTDVKYADDNLIHLVPKGGIPEQDTHKSQPVSHIISVKLSLEKPPSEMTEAEAKAVLASFPLSVAFNPKDAVDLSPADFQKTESQQANKSSTLAGKSDTTLAAGVASSSHSKETIPEDQPRAGPSGTQSEAAPVPQAQPPEATLRRGRSAMGKGKERAEVAIDTADTVGRTGRGGQSAGSSGGVATRTKGKKRVRDQEVEAEEGDVPRPGRGTGRKRRKN